MTRKSPVKLYKNPEQGRIMGVCAGVADYTGVNVCAVRMLTIILAIFTGFWLVLIGYFILGAILEPKPQDLYADEEEEEFWRQTRTQPDYTAVELRRRFRDIETRTAKMEAYMTSKRFRLEQELRSLED
ncbi:envelope stress response membrane protein PspC [Eilatimonas milleporae]|uniref:Phage shock protein C (PspC) family protein n=1 Tax=Eilatimonas milleporae TaxID=911205 RepID=A0A3M0BZ92_9PROT|nr:envelope stress response membrane protein PspC [Eilatimonas milleporae]RMB02808.1 phage shock protein C (PspC) family protein [Eilatimonas milleporae]